MHSGTDAFGLVVPNCTVRPASAAVRSSNVQVNMPASQMPASASAVSTKPPAEPPLEPPVPPPAFPPAEPPEPPPVPPPLPPLHDGEEAPTTASVHTPTNNKI